MTYIIAEPCIGVKDRSCVEVCPVDCIYEYVEEIGGGLGPRPPPAGRGHQQERTPPRSGRGTCRGGPRPSPCSRSSRETRPETSVGTPSGAPTLFPAFSRG